MENYLNDYAPTLASAIANGSVTSIEVSAAASVASGFRIRVAQELMLVTAGGTTTTWTVTRGIEGTTASGHPILTPVHVVISAGSLDQIREDWREAFGLDILSDAKPPGVPRYSTGKQYALTNGVPYTVLNVSGQAGYVSEIWMALDSGGTNETIKLVVDGVTVFEGSYAMFFACRDFRLSRAGRYGNALMADMGGQTWRIPIPFSNSISITVTAASAGLHLWYQISYKQGVPNNWPRTRKLRMVSGEQQSNTIDQVRTLIDVTGIGRGRLLGLYLCIDSATGSASPVTSPLEGRIKIYLDTIKGFESSGTEDYFHAAGFFSFITPGQSVGPYVSLQAEDTNHWHVMRFHVPDPIVFEDELKITVNAGESAITSFTGTVNYSWVIWYYTEN